MNLVTAATRNGAAVFSGAAIRFAADAPVSSSSLDKVVVGFRPECVHLGTGPVSARVRTVEDLGSEVFVHLLVDHEGAVVPIVAKVSAPYSGRPGDEVALNVAGTAHLFDAAGARLVTGQATMAGVTDR